MITGLHCRSIKTQELQIVKQQLLHVYRAGVALLQIHVHFSSLKHRIQHSDFTHSIWDNLYLNIPVLKFEYHHFYYVLNHNVSGAIYFTTHLIDTLYIYDNLIVLGFNDTSTLVGHFVSSPREREKRDGNSR